MWKVTGDIIVRAMVAVPPHPPSSPPLSYHHGHHAKNVMMEMVPYLKKQQI
jgi:hypothetical protein